MITGHRGVPIVHTTECGSTRVRDCTLCGAQLCACGVRIECPEVAARQTATPPQTQPEARVWRPMYGRQDRRILFPRSPHEGVIAQCPRCGVPVTEEGCDAVDVNGASMHKADSLRFLTEEDRRWLHRYGTVAE